MFQVETQFTQDSKACPGVRFTLRVLNQYQRAIRDAKIVDARTRISELAAAYSSLPDPDAEGAPEGAEAARLRIERNTVDHRMGLIITTELKPAYIRASLISVEGLRLNPEPSVIVVGDPWGGLIANAPDELLDEIYAAAVQNSGLSGEQEKN